MTRERFYDLARLVEHGRALQEIAAQTEPTARQIAGASPSRGARLGLLAGSFNPPTIAHEMLAQAGLTAGALDHVWYALSTRTVDKEVVTGAILEDRLLLLDLLTEPDPRLGTLAINRGLYVDQARIVRAAYPELGALVFLVGFDKIVQIFDPRYYDDRDAALAALFELATFQVAPRGDDDASALAALLARPENRRFAAAVQPLDLPSELRDVASSAIRQGLESGGALDQTVSPAVAAFLKETGVYADEARYRERAALIADAVEASADPTNDLWIPRIRLLDLKAVD
jgi:nicotinic acid mononucleotide adenylyltransferase